MGPKPSLCVLALGGRIRTETIEPPKNEPIIECRGIFQMSSFLRRVATAGLVGMLACALFRISEAEAAAVYSDGCNAVSFSQARADLFLGRRIQNTSSDGCSGL